MLNMVVHAFNPGTGKADSWISELKGQSDVHSSKSAKVT